MDLLGWMDLISGEIKVFMVSRGFMQKGEMMKTSLLTSYALDMQNNHVSHYYWVLS